MTRSTLLRTLFPGVLALAIMSSAQQVIAAPAPAQIQTTAPASKSEQKAQRKQQKHQEKAAKANAKAQKDQSKALKQQDKATNEQEKVKPQ